MWRVGVMLLCAGAALAQHVTSADKLPLDLNGFASRHTPLPCTVSAIKPTLNLSFRFQTGYVVRTPLEPYAGAQHHWDIVFAVTPEGDDRQPVYFTDSIDLAPPPQPDFVAETTGMFLVGEGHYDVKWTLLDDLGRVCRQEWSIDAHLKGGVKALMPPGAAGDSSWQPAPPAPVTDTKTRHVTILLNAALPLVRQARSGTGEWRGLLEILSSLLQRIPGANVRMIVFNLDQQRELVRQESFTAADVNRIAGAANGSEQWAVNAGVLLKPSGGWDLLSDLESREIHDPIPSDTIIFLGLTQRTAEKMPAGMPESERSSRYFYLEDRPSAQRASAPSQLGVGGGGGGRGGGGGGGGGGGRGGGRAMVPAGPALTDQLDPIRQTVQRMKGKTIVISSPAALNKAISEIQRGLAR